MKQSEMDEAFGNSSPSPDLEHWNSNALRIVTLALGIPHRVHAAAGIVGLGFRRTRRQVGEHLTISALRTGGAVEFCQRRVISEQRLQARRLRREQLYLCIEHIQLYSRTRI